MLFGFQWMTVNDTLLPCKIQKVPGRNANFGDYKHIWIWIFLRWDVHPSEAWCAPSLAPPRSQKSCHQGAALQVTRKKKQPLLQRRAVVEPSFAAAKTFWCSPLWSETLILELLHLYVLCTCLCVYAYIHIDASRKSSTLKKMNKTKENKNNFNAMDHRRFLQRTRFKFLLTGYKTN